MIRFVIGYPGAGKTLFLVSKIIEELGYTDRFIVTNLEELKLPEMREYLSKRFPDKAIDFDERLLIIAKEETFRFWRYRAGGLRLEDRDWQRMSLEESFAKLTETFRAIANPEHPEWLTPVSYFLSEAHEFFPAKDWEKVGRPVKFYASKHRHLHDEVIIETQFPEQVEPNFRRLAQEWHRLRNFYTMSFGPFKQRGHFERKVYLSMPGPSSVAVDTASYQINKEVANCYHTTGALGIMNRGAEQKGFGRVRKLPWWMMYVLAGVALAVVWVVLWHTPRMIEGAIGGIMGGVQKGVQKATPMPGVQKVSSGREVGTTRGGDVIYAVAPVTVVGYAIVQGGSPRVWLSDGRVLTEADGIKEITQREVELSDGTRFWVQRSRVVPPDTLPPASRAAGNVASTRGG